MAHFYKKTTKTVKRILPVLLLVSSILSCQKEEIFEPIDITTDIPEISYAYEPLQLACVSGDMSDVRWEISDGSSYSGTEITHTFNYSGTYNIKISVYKENIEVSSITKEILIVYRYRTYLSDQNFHSLRAYRASDGSIILDGYIESSESTIKSAFLVLDEKLAIIDTLYDYVDVINRLKKVVQINGSFYLLNEESTESNSAYPFKTSSSSENNITTQVFNYASGLIHYYSAADASLYADFYDKNLQRLWSKKLSAGNTSENTYLFNIEDILYYISFDNTTDSLYIEKFKNVSVSLQKEAYSLGIPASDREILFVFNIPFNNTIALGIYSKSANKTIFYSIDKYCGLNYSAEKEGLFNEVPLVSLENNSFITKNGNKLSKFSSSWETQYERTLETDDFGICKVGSNLFLLFENLPQGLRLSYIDNHLDTVSYE